MSAKPTQGFQCLPLLPQPLQEPLEVLVEGGCQAPVLFLDLHCAEGLFAHVGEDGTTVPPTLSRVCNST